MEKPLRIQFGPYRILRTPDPRARSTARRTGTPFGGALYTVIRPDGKELCCGVSWRDVEQMIHTDTTPRPKPKTSKAPTTPRKTPKRPTTRRKHRP